MKKFWAILLIFEMMIFVSTAHAEIKTYAGTGEYLMSDGETQEIAKQGAKMHALRAAQEQAGIFISSITVIKDHELEKDEVTAFTASILKVGDVSYKAVPLSEENGYIKFVATVTVTIDTNDLNSRIDAWFNSTNDSRAELVEQNQSLQKIIDAQAKRIAELEKIAVVAKTPQEKAKVDEVLLEIDKMTLYAQKIEEIKSIAKTENRNWNEYLRLCNEALKLNTNGVEAYVYRARIYEILSSKTVTKNESERKEYLRLMFNDLDKAIQINPTDSNLYERRAKAYYNEKNFKQAVDNYAKAIHFTDKPMRQSWLYGNWRAMIFYFKLKDYEHAAEDLSHAIEIVNQKGYKMSDDILSWYEYRARCYVKLKDYRRAIADFTKAIEWAPDWQISNLYKERGECYKSLGETAKAQADFAKIRKYGA